MMEILQAHILTWILFSPLLGLPIILFWPWKKEKGKGIPWVGWLSTTFPLLFIGGLLFQIAWGEKSHVQFLESIPWFHFSIVPEKDWIFSYQLGVDGLSLPFISLTVLLFWIASVASYYTRSRQKAYFSLFLLLEVCVLGVFLARNLLLFFLFFELTIILMFFLIGMWGLVGRERAANRFLLYNGVGSLLLFLGFIGLLSLFQTMDFDSLQKIMTDVRLLHGYQDNERLMQISWALFACILIAFSIKLPLFPFHTWMLKVHTEAAPAIVMIHSGILLKMGAYGLFRFGVELFPYHIQQAGWVLGIWGVVSLLYGGILAFQAQDLRQILAYASVSHMGIILLGLSSFTVLGLTGAIFQSISHGLIAALLFFVIGSLYQRTETTQLPELGGLARKMPLLMGIFLIGGLALLGLPTTSGFLAEFFVIVSLFSTHPLLGSFAVLIVLLGAAFTLRAVIGTAWGSLASSWKEVSDIYWWEAIPMFILIGCIFALGLGPHFLISMTKETVELMIGIGG